MRNVRVFAALGLSAALLISACGSDEDTADAGLSPSDSVCEADGPEIVIGAQAFGESAILAEVYGQALADAGCTVRQQSLGGYRDLVFTSFASGDINFTAEYAAAALEFLNGFAGEASGEIAPTAAALQGYLADLGLTALDASPAVDSNAFVVTAETAERLGIARISDLTEGLRLGGPPDCGDNAACIPGLRNVYGLDLSANFIPLDGAGPITVAALLGGEIDVAVLFSTAGVIAQENWVVLDDDLNMINADNIIPVASQTLVDSYGQGFVDLINRVSAALDTPQLTELNRLYDIDKEDADDVARNWLISAGLIAG
jgi:osmoprotectant transport system substrate-binding protein